MVTQEITISKNKHTILGCFATWRADGLASEATTVQGWMLLHRELNLGFITRIGKEMFDRFGGQLERFFVLLGHSRFETDMFYAVEGYTNRCTNKPVEYITSKSKSWCYSIVTSDIPLPAFATTVVKAGLGMECHDG